MKGQGLSPRCHLPWQAMVIYANGLVVPCAYWTGYGTSNPPCGNLNDSHLLEIWNGEVYQKLRRNMAEGNLEAAGCSKCFALQQGIPMGMMYDPDADLESPPPSEYTKHLQLLRKEIANGKAVLESNPTVISLTSSHQCNLRCIHCYQTITRDCRLDRENCIDEIFRLLPTLVRITAGGGEPFLLPLWRHFLGDADLSVNPYLEFAVSTNATLVTEKLINDLRRFKRLAIAISLDGATKEVYEKIRIGSSFEDTVKNVDKLIGLTRKKPRSVAHLVISVMKANIKDLPNLVQFAARKGVTFALIPVMDMPLDQTITCFNNPLSEMAGWKATIEESYKMFDELYAERLSELEGSCRASYRNHIAMIEKTIPWDIRSQDHFLVTGKLPQSAIDLYTRGYGRDLVVAFWTLNGSRPEACHYYSHLNSNQYQVYLPAGDYALEIHSRNSTSGFVPCLYMRVSPTGEASKFYPIISMLLSPAFLRLRIARVLPTSVKNLLKRIFSMA